jgi:hypothetical protein
VSVDEKEERKFDLRCRVFLYTDIVRMITASQTGVLVFDFRSNALFR